MTVADRPDRHQSEDGSKEAKENPPDDNLRGWRLELDTLDGVCGKCATMVTKREAAVRGGVYQMHFLPTVTPLSLYTLFSVFWKTADGLDITPKSGSVWPFEWMQTEKVPSVNTQSTSRTNLT